MSDTVRDPRIPEGAEDYYDVESAVKFFESPVHEDCERWRCVLCGWGIDVPKANVSMAGACCCGGCGMTCLRPIEEYPWNPIEPAVKESTGDENQG